MNGATRLVEALRQSGVRTIFSLSGNQIMPVYDACIDSETRIVHVRHEAAAVYMADAWAQITGEIGVALLTAGPGFANGLSPLYSAAQAESPVLLLSGDSPVGQDGSGAFQEMDQTAITAPLVKRAARVMQADDIEAEVAASVRSARSGRNGPVHLALPFDVLNNKANSGHGSGPLDFSAEQQIPSAAVIAEIAAAMGKASKPLVLLGPQQRRGNTGNGSAIEQVFGVPAIVMESPRGLRDPALGTFAEKLAEADLVVSLGKRLDFTVGFGRPPAISADAHLIVVDPDPALLDRAQAEFGARLIVGAVADAGPTVDALVAGQQYTGCTDWFSEVASAVAVRTAYESEPGKIHPAEICRAVDRFLESRDDPLLVCDGGEFGQWAQAFCKSPKRIINGSAGAIGGGLCYAFAAKLASPESTVVVLMGDGTAGFHFTEFDTAFREDAPVIAIIGNDDRWNAEYQIQLRDYGPDRLIGCELAPGTRYDLAALGFGCHGEFVTDGADIAPAIQRAAESGLPACINIAMDGAAAPDHRNGSVS